MDAETFLCPNCDTDIPVGDAESTGAVVCPQCGHGYRVEYDDLMESYRLIPDEPPLYPTDIDTDRV